MHRLKPETFIEAFENKAFDSSSLHRDDFEEQAAYAVARLQGCVAWAAVEAEEETAVVVHNLWELADDMLILLQGDCMPKERRWVRQERSQKAVEMSRLAEGLCLALA